MNSDEYGQCYLTSDNIIELLYKNPDADLLNFSVTDPEPYNKSVDVLKVDFTKLTKYTKPNIDLVSFDLNNQNEWLMPEFYKQLDIAKYILDTCANDHELQRCGQELLLYQEYNLFDLLKYLKYLVDTMREHNIVWGVGRGSSVASFVLYKLGVHKVNSLFYDLDINEFLKG